MTLQQLEYVLAVDQHKSFSRAAEHCNVTQPTLSAMINKLESELDVRIFDRSIHPIVTTTVGAKIIEKARQVLHQAAIIPDIVAEERNTISGTLRLAVLPTIAPYLVPRFHGSLCQHCPELTVQLIELRTEEIKQALRMGDIDAGILADLGEWPGLRSTSLYYESFFVYAAENENIFTQEVVKASDIVADRLWLLDEGHCFRDQLARFCQMEAVQLNQTSYRMGSMETFMRMVEAGHGVTFIPALAVEQFSPQQMKHVRPFAIPRPTRHVVLTTREDYVRQQVIDRVVERIRQSVPSKMHSLRQAQTLI
ncbi:MAG: hydrogen peroxide-inducible genes activator [Bacteroidales bacterium]|nr:hydrogen peroxide-inducible genes activator [Bacteroidales bacterium]